MKTKQLLKKITLTILLTLLTPLQSFAAFSDVLPTDPQFNAIKSLELKKIIKSYPDGTFKPKLNISRAEFLKLIFNDIGYQAAEKPYNTFFKDVPENSWFAGYIKKAVDLGIINSYTTNSYFYPEKPITKVEAIRIAFSLEGIPTPYLININQNDLFKDVKPNSWFAYLAHAAKKNNIISAKNPDIFGANKNLTRGDAAELIYALENRQNNQGTIILKPVEQPSNKPLDQDTSKLIDNSKFPILLDIWKTANNSFYYKNNFTQNDLIYGAIEGMVNKLNDKYTTFQEPAKAGKLNNFLNGEFDGIGATLDSINKQVIIAKPLPNSPAQKAGLKRGDIIKKVDDKNIDTLTLENVIDLIKGPAGTSVTLTIMRNNQTLEFNIVRAKITIASVETKIIGANTQNSIGYIKINQFVNNTTSEFETAINTLNAASPKGLILDMRDNPGGYLDSAINILGYFISNGKTVVSTKDVNDNIVNFTSNGKAELAKYPLIVLIDNNSASAAEIVAGAIQDYKLGQLIGEKSFGKGSVQQLVTYPDNSILKITTAHWLTPLGRDIHGTSLIPDIQISLTQNDITNEKDPQLDQAIAILKK